MKNFKTNIFLFAMLVASPLTVSAQADDDVASTDSTVAKKKVHVAFRDVDPDQLLGGVSYVDMEELSKKDYTTSSLEDMNALVGGWNGNNLWGMDNERLDNNDNSNMPVVIIDGIKRPSNNVLPCYPDYHQAWQGGWSSDYRQCQHRFPCGQGIP